MLKVYTVEVRGWKDSAVRLSSCCLIEAPLGCCCVYTLEYSNGNYVELLFSSFMIVALIMLQVDVFQQEQVPTARSSTAQSDIIHSMTQACTLSRTTPSPHSPQRALLTSQNITTS